MRLRALVPWLLAAVGCGPLQPIAAGVCGNGVLEAGESCDPGAPVRSGSCGAAASAHPCRHVCATTPDCPAGHGCGSDGVCRQAGAGWGVAAEVGAGAEALTAVHTAEGMPAFVALGAPDALGRRGVRITVLEAVGAPALVAMEHRVAAVRALPETTAFMHTLSGGLGVSRLAAGRLVPEFFPTLTLAAGGRVVGVDGFPESAGEELLLMDYDEPTARLTAVGVGMGLVQLGSVPVAGRGDFGRLATGHVDLREACPELFVPNLGREVVHVVAPCRVDAAAGVAWNEAALPATVRTSGGARLRDAPLLVADLDADGHADLVLPTDQGPQVAPGDGLGVAAVAQAVALPEAGVEASPLALGDLDGDAFADAVTGTGIWLQTPAGWVRAAAGAGVLADVALIADLNRDGHPDVVAGTRGAASLTRFLGAGGGAFNPTQMALPAPLDHLVLAELDGDLFPDLVLSTPPTAEGRSELYVAYGAAGLPEPAVHVGGADHLTSLATLRLSPTQAGRSAIEQLIVIGAPPTAARGHVALVSGDGTRELVAPHVFVNAGTGTYSEPVALGAGTFREVGVEAAVATIDRAGAPVLRLWRSSLTPAAGPETSLLPGPTLDAELVAAGLQVLVGEVDGAGAAEAVVVGVTAGGEPRAQVARLDGERFALSPAVSLGAPGEADAVRFSLAELDGDGRAELVVTDAPGGQPRLRLVDLREGAAVLAEAAFDAPITALGVAPAGSDPPLVALTAAGAFAVRWVARALEVAPVPELGGGRAVAFQDFDRDGIVDCLVASASATALHLRLEAAP